MALERCSGYDSNHYDLTTRERYWISGVKKRGSNRHWAGGGPIHIEESVVDWYHDYAEHVDFHELIVIPDLPKPDISKFNAIENEKVAQQD